VSAQKRAAPESRRRLHVICACRAAVPCLAGVIVDAELGTGVHDARKRHVHLSIPCTWVLSAASVRHDWSRPSGSKIGRCAMDHELAMQNRNNTASDACAYVHAIRWTMYSDWCDCISDGGVRLWTIEVTCEANNGVQSDHKYCFHGCVK
jgi:hypothetical protein